MKKTREEFPDGSVVRTQHFHCQGLGTTTDQGALIPQAMWHSQKEKKKVRKPQGGITSHWSEWLSSKRTRRTNVGKDAEKRELVQPLWKMVWRFLKSLKIELPYDPAIPLLGIYTWKKHTYLKRYVHPNVHSSIFFTIAKDREAT